MTAAQLRWFLSDMQEKLQVLSSQEARDANTYLAETFAVASPAYTRIIRRKLPDVLAMTAAQVDRQLAIFAAKHQSMLEMQKIFQQSTQQEIAYNEQQILAIREEHEHALDRAESAAAAWDTSAFFQCDCGGTVWFGCIALEAAVRQSSQRGPFFAAHRAGCSRRASFASLIKLTSDSARFKSSSGVPQDLHCIALTPLARDQEWSS